jgi:hypothetical protein
MPQPTEFGDAALPDFTWTTRGDPAISHVHMIDSGATAEVHEARSLLGSFGTSTDFS